MAPKSTKSQMRGADKSQARFCLILGEAELAAGTVVVKNMRDASQATVPLAGVIDLLRL